MVSEKIGVLHILGTFTHGGMESNLLNYLYNANYDKFEHHIFVARDEGHLRKYFQKLPIKIIVIKWNLIRSFYNLPFGYYYCKKNKIKIIHGHNFESCLYGYFISILARRQLFTSSYSPGFGRWFTKRNLFWESMIFKKASINISVSKAILDEEIAVAKPSNDSLNKYKLIYPIIKDISQTQLIHYNNFMIRQELKINNDRPVLTIIGRLNKVKGHRLAIDAVDEINKKGLRVNLLIVGREDDTSILHESDLEKEYIRYFDYFESLEKIWAVTDIFLISSLSEGTPLVLIEYFAIGKPVIASAVYGNKELIQDGVNGFLFAPGDKDDLISTIYRVIECQNMDEIKERAVRYYHTSLSPQKLTRSMEFYYSESVWLTIRK